MDLVYTDANHNDVAIMTVITSFDLSFGDAGNDWELTVPLAVKADIEPGSLVYIDGTEFGGIVDSIGVDTKTKNHRAIYGGRSWHGMLDGKVISPDAGQAYLRVAGDANAVLLQLIERTGLTDLFTASAQKSGIGINYQFARYVTGYRGIRSMLSASGAKLRVAWEDNRVVLSASPIADFSQESELDTDRLEFAINRVFRPINHLTCLGKGELQDRDVIHLYADKNGAVSSRQTLCGIHEVNAVYDYNNVDHDELLAKGTEKLEECQHEDTCDVDLGSGYDYDIGDIVGAYDNDTGVSVVAAVATKNVTIKKGRAIVSYEVGETTRKSSFRGSGESSGTGQSYVAGSNITIVGQTINAAVGLADVAAVDNIARAARTEASNTAAALGAVRTTAESAVQNVTAAGPILVTQSGAAVVIGHSESGAVAGEHGAAADAAPGWGETISVGAQFCVNTTGHIISTTERIATIPSSDATAATHGLMGVADKLKLDGVALGANNYTLPVATTRAIGGVKPDGVTITVSSDGTVSSAQGGAASFLAAHPAGSLYWTERAANPGVLYGGSWELRKWPHGYLWARTA